LRDGEEDEILEGLKLAVHESVEIGAPPQSVWRLLTDIHKMPMFSGFGPIPGIQSARWVVGESCLEGAARQVRNTDGSTHIEDVVIAAPPSRLEDRIHGFTSPFRLLVREVRDRFELVPKDGATVLERTFAIELKSPVWLPVAAMLVPLLRQAVRRHHRAIIAELQRARDARES
jgi:carbon monoxide dehydrogenase subunit G